MASQSFEEMEREYGYALDDHLDDFGLELSQHINPYANHSNDSEGVYFDDIGNFITFAYISASHPAMIH